MDTFTMPIIGVIRTPFATVEDIPRQAHLSRDVTGRAELYPEYAPGLRDLAEFPKAYLFFGFHTAGRTELVTRSRRQGREMGVFATRSPFRPSRMGMSLVEMVSVNGPVLTFKGVDMQDGTPLLDIKPWMEDCG
jgi:tRNA-Thr(GGU) m(6)t(6)A37 methyltransferase TsaA